jgi:ribosomal protein S18 acetylase RimI-like enzyme
MLTETRTRLPDRRRRGMTSAYLGVDADNPTGALGLYEGLGFEVDFRRLAQTHDREGRQP